jgi:hypothetical protein
LFVGLLLYAILITKNKTKIQIIYDAPDERHQEVKEDIKMTLTLTSPAFGDNQSIPKKYTCDGDDINPPLEIKNVPESTISLTLIVNDPDAPSGDWTHWLVWNIDPETTTFEEGKVPEGSVQGLTDFKKYSYSGPCPSKGTHKYQFRIFALDIKLNLNSNANKKDLENAIKNHIVGQSLLTGIYER